MAIDVASKYRRALSMIGLMLKAAADDADSASIWITTVSGAPSDGDGAPNGSFALRKDGAAETTAYVKVSGAYVALGSASGAVLDVLFDANTILKADTDNTPVALTVAEDTIVGRLTAGSITALSVAQVRTLLDVLTAATLAATTNGNGASLIGIEDAGTLYAATTVEGALAEVRTEADTANARIVNRVDPMAVFGTWAVDGDGARTNGAGLVGATPVLTAVAAGQAKCDNGGVIGNLSAGPLAGYTSNYQLFPDAPADDDAFYVGQSVPFCEVAFNVGVAQSSTGGCFTWEYWNGAWSTLTLAWDGTSAAATDGSRSFERDGAISFVPPADWAQTGVNGVTVYWIRCRVSTVANIGVALGTMDATTPEVVTPGDGFLARLAGTIETIRLSDAAATLHTTADVKFILMNYTTGAHSGVLTFAQDQRTDYWSGLSLATANGDELGVVVTQEDGANEPTNVMLELGYVVA